MKSRLKEVETNLKDLCKVTKECKDWMEKREKIGGRSIVDGQENMLSDMEENKEKGENMIRDKLKMNRFQWSNISGKVIIVKTGNEEMKKEMMLNKNKLKGEKIFIENDLSWEEKIDKKRYTNRQKNKERKERK